MEDFTRTLFWGAVAVALFGVLAALVFCAETAGVFQSDACWPVMAAIEWIRGRIGW